MAGLIPGKQTTRFGALWDGDDGGAAGAGDVSGPDESNAFGTDPGAGISDPGTGVSGAVGPGAGGDIGAAIGAGEAAAMAASVAQAEEDAFGGLHSSAAALGQPALGGFHGFLNTPIVDLPDPLGRFSPTFGRALVSLALAPLGPLGMAVTAPSMFGLEGIDESADDAVAAQEATAADAGAGDVGAFPFIQPPPSIATPQAAQAALPPIAPPVPAMQGPRNFRSPASPALDPALLAAFQQRLARISGV